MADHQKTVVILGASYAGLGIAHKLLKHTYAATPTFKVILVSPSTHLYWNMAATRAIIPGAIPDADLFHPILPAFSKYPTESFSFLEGAAESVDPEARSVTVKLNNAGGTQTLQYSILVLTTGASCTKPYPFKCTGSYAETLADLHNLQSRIAEAQSYIVGGGGITGVEVAGELGFEYSNSQKSSPKKPITLISATPHVIPALRSDVGLTAESELRKFNVTITPNSKVVSTAPSGPDGKQTTVTLSNGETLTTDLYIPTTGVRANTSYLPPAFLDPTTGDLLTDSLLRPTALPESLTNTIFAAGDITSLEAKQITHTEYQLLHLAQNLHYLLLGQPEKMTEYRTARMNIVALTVGRHKGTGLLGWWRIWSWGVWIYKGRTLALEKARGFAAGERLVLMPWL